MLGVVLAGGRSTRMGRDKALLEVDGARLLARNLTLLREVCGDACIVARDAAQSAAIRVPGARMITDAIPDCGPLGGLHSAFEHSADDLFVVACDMPALEASLLQRLAAAFAEHRPRLLLPVTSHGPQPLCAIWSRECKADVSAALAARTLSLVRLIQSWPEVRTYPIKPGDDDQFRNLNSPQDLS